MLLETCLNALPDKVQDDGPVRHVRTALVEIESALSFPPGAVPSQQAIKDLSVTTAELLKEISQKK